MASRSGCEQTAQRWAWRAKSGGAKPEADEAKEVEEVEETPDAATGAEMGETTGAGLELAEDITEGEESSWSEGGAAEQDVASSSCERRDSRGCAMI
jgi:hypothetical protein